MSGDLAGRHLALLSGGFATRVQVDAYFTAHKVQPRIAVEANSVPVLIEIVRRTSLATVLPDAITDDNPYLAPVPLEPALPARTVTLLRREDAYQSAAARAFIHLTQQLVHRTGAPQRGRLPRDVRRPRYRRRAPTACLPRGFLATWGP